MKPLERLIIIESAAGSISGLSNAFYSDIPISYDLAGYIHSQSLYRLTTRPFFTIDEWMQEYAEFISLSSVSGIQMGIIGKVYDVGEMYRHFSVYKDFGKRYS